MTQKSIGEQITDMIIEQGMVRIIREGNSNISVWAANCHEQLSELVNRYAKEHPDFKDACLLIRLLAKGRKDELANAALEWLTRKAPRTNPLREELEGGGG
jgi:hypothetical protein